MMRWRPGCAAVAAGAERAGLIDERASDPARRRLSLHLRPEGLGPSEVLPSLTEVTSF
jgi:hypothetical protein